MFLVKIRRPRSNGFSHDGFLNIAGRPVEYTTRAEAIAAAEKWMSEATPLDSPVSGYTIEER